MTSLRIPESPQWGKERLRWDQVFRALHRRPLHSLHHIERSIIIDRELEDIRSMLDEGDPMLHESSRQISLITAAYLLWNLEIAPIGDGRLTHVRATPSDQNESYDLKTYMSRKGLHQELCRLKQLMEGDGPSVHCSSEYGDRKPGSRSWKNLCSSFFLPMLSRRQSPHPPFGLKTSKWLW